MENDQKKRREDELDRFWDIDALIPKKRAVHMPADTETAEIVLEPRYSKSNSAPVTEKISRENGVKRHFIPPHTAEEFNNRPVPDEEYTPDNALIRRVRLYKRKSDYRYYDTFARDAAKLYAIKGVSCPRVPFFSYVPQYNQMSRPQLEWYLCWRAAVRRGDFPDTDYSYVLLYAYELINLSDKLDPKKVQEELCKIWIHYRDTFHQLDSYLPDWICDCSLIHHLPPPVSCTGDLLAAVMSHSTLKEFYVPSGKEDVYVRALLAFGCNYNYRKSKFCVGEHIVLFDTAIMGALRVLTEHVSRDGKLFSTSGMEDSRLTRDAYTGALCSWRIKRKIEVDFCSFSRSHELRFLVTDAVKYTENKIRAAIGVRSRLTVYALSVSVRQILDGYLETVLPKRITQIQKENEPVPAYEKLYDLPRRELSLSNAAEIERQSWDTTERLIEAFEDKREETKEVVFSSMSEPVLSAVAEPTDETDQNDGLFEAISQYLPFLQTAFDKDTAGQRKIAQEAGLPLEVLADQINSIAADLTGDILLEECNGVFAVIEEYREQVLTLLAGKG